MMKASNTSDGNDLFDLERFLIAQKSIYRKVLSELNNGQKESHWMWFIFPQFDGLGFSYTAKRYAIKTLEEAQHYLDYPILGARLKECTETVLGVDDRSILRILGHPDDLKFKSSMTLFSLVSAQDSVFDRALEKYFDGEHDRKTLELLSQTS
jgi:uncharacterized protein (DUF1810 family)